MAFGMDYEKILRRHVLEEELRGGTDAVKDADLKLTAPPIKPQNKTNTTKENTQETNITKSKAGNIRLTLLW